MNGGTSTTLAQGSVPIDEIIVTDELRSRAPKRRNYRREKEALQELAHDLGEAPSEVLPRFVDVAMELTGGSSAGISLYEAGPEAGLFRWHHVRGALAPFDGATAPRDYSPCGVTLDRNGPVLANSPERYYAWIADADLTIPEVLLVPLHIGSDEPLGTLWVVADQAGHFRSEDVSVATELAEFVAVALKIIGTEGKLRASLRHEELLAREWCTG